MVEAASFFKADSDVETRHLTAVAVIAFVVDVAFERHPALLIALEAIIFEAVSKVHKRHSKD